MILTVQLLVDALILLVVSNTKANKELVEELLVGFDNLSNMDDDDEAAYRFYSVLIRELMKSDTLFSTKAEIKTIVLKTMMVIGETEENNYFKNKVEWLVDMAPEETKDLAKDCKLRVAKALSLLKAEKYSSKLYALRKSAESSLASDPEACMEFINEGTKIFKELDEFQKKHDGSQNNTATNPTELDFMDEEEVQAVFTVWGQQMSDIGKLKAAHSCFNYIFGKDGLIPRGLIWNIVGPSGKGKSLVNRLLVASIMIGTDWHKWREEEKRKGNDKPPLMYYATLENELHQDAMWFHRAFYGFETGNESPYYKVLKTSHDEVEKAKARSELRNWMAEFYTRLGIRLKMTKVDPFKTSMDDTCAKMVVLMTEFTIIINSLDYLKIYADAQPGESKAYIINLLMFQWCLFCRSYGIMGATPSQAARAAVIKVADYDNHVNHFTEYVQADSSAGVHLPDVILFTSQEANDSDPPQLFQTFAVKKNRFGEEASQASKQFAIPFAKEGPAALLPDHRAGRRGFTRNLKNWTPDETWDPVMKY